MILAKCHCGAIEVQVPAKPDYMNDCNCTLCRKSGAVWGYYAGADIKVHGETRTYTRADLADPAIHLHFCAGCGATTHWTLTDGFKARQPGADRVGVNMRLVDDAATLAGVELRFPDGRAWGGSTAPRQRRSAVVIGADGEF